MPSFTQPLNLFVFPVLDMLISLVDGWNRLLLYFTLLIIDSSSSINLRTGRIVSPLFHNLLLMYLTTTACSRSVTIKWK